MTNDFRTFYNRNSYVLNALAWIRLEHWRGMMWSWLSRLKGKTIACLTTYSGSKHKSKCLKWFRFMSMRSIKSTFQILILTLCWMVATCIDTAPSLTLMGHTDLLKIRIIFWVGEFCCISHERRGLNSIKKEISVGWSIEWWSWKLHSFKRTQSTCILHASVSSVRRPPV